MTINWSEVQEHIHQTILRPHIQADRDRPLMRADTTHFHYIDGMCFLSRITDGMSAICGVLDEDNVPCLTARDFYKALTGKLPLSFYAHFDGFNNLLKLSTDDTTGKEIVIGARAYMCFDNFRNQIPFIPDEVRARVYTRVIDCITRDMPYLAQMGMQGGFPGIDDEIARYERSIKETAELVFRVLTGINPRNVCAVLNADGTFARLIPFLIHHEGAYNHWSLKEGQKVIPFIF